MFLYEFWTLTLLGAILAIPIRAHYIEFLGVYLVIYLEVIIIYFCNKILKDVWSRAFSSFKTNNPYRYIARALVPAGILVTVGTYEAAPGAKLAKYEANNFVDTMKRADLTPDPKVIEEMSQNNGVITKQLQSRQQKKH